MNQRIFVRIGMFFVTVSLAMAAPPKNIIFMIGDGMGFEQVKAASIYKYGEAGKLSFETLPYQGQVTTYSANSGTGYTNYTDSAAGGTALATGHKVNNGVISLAIPGDGSERLTLLEYSKARGKSTGLVTTAYLSHATPAAFGAHETYRENYDNIAKDLLTQTKPNVMLGGAAHVTSSAAVAAGYNVVTNRTGMLSLNPDTETYVAGLFGSGYMTYEYDGTGLGTTYPHLREMTATALDILDEDPDGFFLMVEGARIDHAGHSNLIRENICETIEFANAVQVAMDWAAGREDTIIIVTADHETGGLTVTETNPQQGVFPSVTWYWGNHTGQNVPVYAYGVNANRVHGTLDNTNFFDICTSDETPADLDGDLQVDLTDFAGMSEQWKAPMDMDDLGLMAESWLYGVNQYALWFDGLDDYVTITGYKGISGGKSRTCSAWILTSKLKGEIMSWGSTETGGKWIIRVNERGELRAEIQGGSIYGTTPINDGSWHHIAVVLDDDGSTNIAEAKLYVDGQLETVGGFVEAQVNTSEELDVVIGSFPLFYGKYFRGLIDEVKIYDRALSGSEIASTEPVTNGLVAYWKMDEGVGNNVEDSISSYTGTISGAQWLPWR